MGRVLTWHRGCDSSQLPGRQDLPQLERSASGRLQVFLGGQALSRHTSCEVGFLRLFFVLKDCPSSSAVWTPSRSM